MTTRAARRRWWRLVRAVIGALFGSCFFVLFILASVGIGFHGLDLVREAGVLADRGETAPGMVTDLWVDVQYFGDDPPTRTETITVEFRTPDGTRHTLSEPGDTAEGARVSVWYDPDDPDEVATLHDPGTHRVVGILLIVVGAIFVVGGIGMAAFAARDWLAGRR